MDLTEAEHIKKPWQENTEELYKKDLQDQDNQDGMVLTEADIKRWQEYKRIIQKRS